MDFLKLLMMSQKSLLDNYSLIPCRMVAACSLLMHIIEMDVENHSVWFSFAGT